MGKSHWPFGPNSIVPHFSFSAQIPSCFRPLVTVQGITESWTLLSAAQTAATVSMLAGLVMKSSRVASAGGFRESEEERQANRPPGPEANAMARGPLSV